MKRRDEIPTCYTRKSLRQSTNAQDEKLKELKAKMIGLTIFGTVKAATRHHVFLIERDGFVSMKAKAYARWVR